MLNQNQQAKMFSNLKQFELSFDSSFTAPKVSKGSPFIISIYVGCLMLEYAMFRMDSYQEVVNRNKLDIFY